MGRGRRGWGEAAVPPPQCNPASVVRARCGVVWGVLDAWMGRTQTGGVHAASRRGLPPSGRDPPSQTVRMEEVHSQWNGGCTHPLCRDDGTRMAGNRWAGSARGGGGSLRRSVAGRGFGIRRRGCTWCALWERAVQIDQVRMGVVWLVDVGMLSSRGIWAALVPWSDDRSAPTRPWTPALPSEKQRDHWFSHRG